MFGCAGLNVITKGTLSHLLSRLCSCKASSRSIYRNLSSLDSVEVSESVFVRRSLLSKYDVVIEIDCMRLVF